MPPDFSPGGMPTTGYHIALAKGEDPDTDPELVEAQWQSAVRTFQLGAEQYAAALVLDDEVNMLNAHLVLSTGGYDALASSLIRSRAWTESATFWGNYSLPEPRSHGEVVTEMMEGRMSQHGP